MSDKPHFISKEDIKDMDMAEILLEAQGVINEDSSVTIEGFDTFTYQQLKEELEQYGY